MQEVKPQERASKEKPRKQFLNMPAILWGAEASILACLLIACLKEGVLVGTVSEVVVWAWEIGHGSFIALYGAAFALSSESTRGTLSQVKPPAVSEGRLITSVLFFSAAMSLGVTYLAATRVFRLIATEIIRVQIENVRSKRGQVEKASAGSE